MTAVSWPRYVDGVSNLAHKIVDLTDCRALVCLVEMDGRVFCVVRTRVAELDAAAIAAALGGGGHAQAASAIHRGSLGEARELAPRGASGGPPPPPDCGRDHVAPCRASSRRTTRSRTRWSSASATARAACRWASRPPGRHGHPRRPRQGDRPWPLPRASEKRDELGRRHVHGGDAARRGDAHARPGRRRAAFPSSATAGRRRRHAHRPAPRARGALGAEEEPGGRRTSPSGCSRSSTSSRCSRPCRR